MAFFTRLRDHLPLYTRIIMYLSLMALIVMMFPREGKFKYEFRKGKPWMHEDMVAPYDFGIYKDDDQIQKEKQSILLGSTPYYQRDTIAEGKKRESFLNELDKFFPDNTRLTSSEQIFNKIAREEALAIYDTLFTRGIIENPSGQEKEKGGRTVNLIIGNTVVVYPISHFFTLQSAYQYIKNQASKSSLDGSIQFMKFMEGSLERNIRFNENLTKIDLDEKINAIPKTNGMVQQGERIISRGELITDEKFRILESLKKDYEEKLGLSARFAGVLIGQIILAGISTLVLVFFLYFFRREVFKDHKRSSLILILILLAVGLTSLLLRTRPDLLYIVPICLIPIIMRVFFDSRLALYVHIITIILIGFMAPNGFEFIFQQFIAGIITIFSVVNFQRRSQFVFSAFMIFVVYNLIYIGNLLVQDGNLSHFEIFRVSLYGGNAFLMLLAYPLIYLFEKTFGYITEVTLLEISDTNMPLLRELAKKAPGTFQHSLQVANLAEEVIREIGGNPLLVRAGALYHDIGKIEMPQYFVENQVTGFNPHSELTNEESAAIIVSHVVRGVEKAKKHSIPEQVIDFIRTHHGTRRAEYFYKKSIDEAGGGPVDADVFTYRGPIPFSRETAVLMMCDSVEAASRSINKPDVESISNLVDKIFESQVRDGQFNNSPITLRDIAKANRILKNQLLHIYHLRIEYPR